MSPVGRPKRAAPEGPAGRRLLGRAPTVYLGPGALPRVGRVKGLLFGARRPGWVDVLDFEPWPGVSWRKLVALRLSEADPLKVVGVALKPEELARHRRTLLRELVPGDVVLVLPEGRRTLRGYVHRGDALVLAPLKRSRYADSL